MSDMAFAAHRASHANKNARDRAQMRRHHHHGANVRHAVALPVQWSGSCNARTTVMWMRRRVGWGCLIACAPLLVPAAARAASYSARARWRPSGEAGVEGYRIYTRVAGGSFARTLDAGMPAPASDGTLATVVSGLETCMSHGVVVVGYGASGETALSNEIVLTYPQVAPVIDTDHDGLPNAAEDRDLDCVVDVGETDPGRVDTDGDGVGDAVDRCQGTATGMLVNATGCSCTQITPCDDGNACNGRELCAAGTCQPGAPLDCNDGNPCTADACSQTAACIHTPVAGCTVCSTMPECDDGNPCTSESCTGGRCARAALADGTPCADELFCNGVEICHGGRCVTRAPVACSDGNVCTVDTCSESERRCVYGAVADCCASDADCAPTDACHTNPRCESGRCVSDAVVCPPPAACGEASCDPVAGCRTEPLPDGTPCDDGDACTLGDVCRTGICAADTGAARTETTPGGTRTRLTMRRNSRGLLVRMRASFPAVPDIDLRNVDVTIGVRDQEGRSVLEVTIPAARFAPGSTGRAVYRDDRRGEGGALTIVDLRAAGSRGTLTLLASLPGPEPEQSIVEALPTMTASATLDWTLRANDRCNKGSGHCHGRGRRCR